MGRAISVVSCSHIHRYCLPYPRCCYLSHQHQSLTSFTPYRIFFYGPLWATMISSSISYFLTYTAVRKTEKASSKWKSKLSSSEAKKSTVQRKMKKDEDDRMISKQVSTQALYYTMAFCEFSV